MLHLGIESETAMKDYWLKGVGGWVNFEYITGFHTFMCKNDGKEFCEVVAFTTCGESYKMPGAFSTHDEAMAEIEETIKKALGIEMPKLEGHISDVKSTRRALSEDEIRESLGVEGDK
jgi:hypothetical protein